MTVERRGFPAAKGTGSGSLRAQAGRFLKGWIQRAIRSRLEPIKEVARSLRAHEDLILNWLAAKKEYSSRIVEDSQQGQTDYQKSMRIPRARNRASLAISRACQIAGAETRPHILLRRFSEGATHGSGSRSSATGLAGPHRRPA